MPQTRQATRKVIETLHNSSERGDMNDTAHKKRKMWGNQTYQVSPVIRLYWSKGKDVKKGI